jgi:hypothetical protein
MGREQRAVGHLRAGQQRLLHLLRRLGKLDRGVGLAQAQMAARSRLIGAGHAGIEEWGDRGGDQFPLLLPASCTEHRVGRERGPRQEVRVIGGRDESSRCLRKVHAPHIGTVSRPHERTPGR